jgi:hypothetical protein
MTRQELLHRPVPKEFHERQDEIRSEMQSVFNITSSQLQCEHKKTEQYENVEK